MTKDPAFLFYSQDFYTGTRLMLPIERACYVDLLIYQHQNNGVIPFNLDRVLMFCSGIDKATLEATLEAKFKRGENGWYNSKLEKVINERKSYKNVQSINGKLGQFWKKVKNILPKREFEKIRKTAVKFNKQRFYDLIKEIDLTNIKDLKATLEASLQHLEDEIEDENEIKDGIENGNEKIIFPFESQKFKTQWTLWKDYKNTEFKFKYKSRQSEQASLKQLSNKSKGDEETAIAIIHQSMANGWKGFFELKKESKNLNNTTDPNFENVEMPIDKNF